MVVQGKLRTGMNEMNKKLICIYLLNALAGLLIMIAMLILLWGGD